MSDRTSSYRPAARSKGLQLRYLGDESLSQRLPAMLTVLGTEEIRLSKAENNTLRRIAAVQGVVVSEPRTREALLLSILSLLPDNVIDRLTHEMATADQNVERHETRSPE